MARLDVDTAITMAIGPLIDDTDFKTQETAIAYDEAGMSVTLFQKTSDGTITTTAITPTTGAANDWTHKAQGIYELEITAAQNDVLGDIWIEGLCNGVMPFGSVAVYTTETIGDIPTANVADSGSAVEGTVDSGTYASTALADGTFWQISPDGANALDVQMTFGLGLEKRVSAITIHGRFTAAAVRYVDIYAYNYDSTSWDKLSNSDTRMNHSATANADYGPFILTDAHQQNSDGECKVRCESVSTTSGDDLYLDQVLVLAIALGQHSLNDIANAVVSHDVSDHTDHNSFGFRAALSMIEEYAVTTADTATSFTCSSLPATANYYQYHQIRVHDVTNDREGDSWILSMDNAGVVVLGRALPFTPDTSSELYIMAGLVSPSEINDEVAISEGESGMTVKGAPQDTYTVASTNTAQTLASAKITVDDRSPKGAHIFIEDADIRYTFGATPVAGGLGYLVGPGANITLQDSTQVNGFKFISNVSGVHAALIVTVLY